MHLGPARPVAVVLLALIVWRPITAQAQAVFLSLGPTRTITTNNTEILITDIGEDGGLPRLTCNTDLTECCRGMDHPGSGGLGSWSYPDGTIIPNNAGGQAFYIVRNEAMLIRLSRHISANAMGPTGSYCCMIPTNGGEMTFCANLVTSLTPTDPPTTEAPTTQAPMCTDLPMDTNGMITYDMETMNSRPVGTMATYTCVNGYQISTGVTMTTVTCDASGDWDSLPTCTAVDCGDPPVIENGSRMFTTTTFGSTTTYTCDNGHTLSGSNMITCQASGSWQTAPMCTVTSSTTTPTMSTSVAPTTTPPPPPVVTVDPISPSGDDTAGEVFTLTCSASVDGTTDTPTFQWFHDNMEVLSEDTTRTVTDGGVSPFSSVLTFNPLRQSHDGTYTCRVNVGGVSSNMTTTITVKAPTITAAVSASVVSPTAGESFTLTCTVTGAELLDPTITYQWFLENPSHVAIPDETLMMLIFNPLRLSNAARYSCDVSVSSNYLNGPLTTSSIAVDVELQIPPPTMTLTRPDNVFDGDSPQLTCTVQVDDSVDVLVSVDVIWTGPTGAQFSSNIGNADIGAVESSATFTTTVNDIMVSDSGLYMCSAQLSSTFSLLDPSNIISRSDNITVIPAPSSPSVSVVPQTTSLSFSWTQPQGDVVENYDISFAYVGDCEEIQTSFPTQTGSRTSMTFTGRDLQEFSNYSLSVIAVNRVDSSTPAVLLATTLPVAPSARVQNLMVSSSNSTSVSLQWDRVDCIDRNSEITGYTVTFGPNTISGTEVRVFTASGLIPRTEYTFTVTPVGESGPGPVETGTVETALPDELTFQLNGVFYSNNSLVTLEDVGAGTTTALLCFTTATTCCRNDDTTVSTGLGMWYFPDQTEVQFGSANEYFMTRGPSVVRLNQDGGSRPGIYRCQIPDGNDVNQDLYIGLYPTNQGSPTIPMELVFNRDALTLTCTSTGGPASEVIWTRDGVMVTEGSTYSLTQTVTITANGTYENVLTATDIADLVGTFSCTVRNVRGNDTMSVLLNGIRILGGDSPLTVGSDASLSCVSDSQSDMIQWIDGRGMEVLMTTTEVTLDLSFTPVSDSLHNSVYTCRVTRGGETGEQSVTLTVTVPENSVTVMTTVPQSLVAGMDYTFRCEVNATISGLMNSPTAVWLTQSEMEIASGGNIIVSTTPRVAELTFSSVSTFQAGTYICRGQLTSPALSVPQENRENVDISVQIPTPGVSVAMLPSPLYAGTSPTLTCTVTVDSVVNTDVNVTTTWERTRESGDVSISTDVSTSGSRPSFTSTLSGLIVSTLDTGFTCRAVVNSLQETSLVVDSPEGAATLSATVTTPPIPMVTIAVSGSPVAGSMYGLTCTAMDIPSPLVDLLTMTWTRNNGSTETGMGVTSSLTFDPLRTRQGGSYTCLAEFDIAEANLPDLSDTTSTTVTVQIPQPTLPPLRGSPVDSGFNTGLELDLICEVELDPSVDSPLSVNRTWTKDGGPLTPDGIRLNISDPVRTQESPQVYQTNVSFNTLNTRDGDSGNYGCMFTIDPDNGQFITGTTAETNRDIVVEDFLVQRVVIPPEVSVPAGSPHTLTCTATKDESLNNAILEVEWFDPLGSLISGSNDIIVIGETTTTDFTLTSSLMFSSLMTSQAGPYTCSVNLTIPGADVIDHNVRSTSIVKAQIPPPQSVTVTASRSEPHYEGTTGLVLTCTVQEDKTGVDTATMVDRTITPVSDSRLTVTDVDQTTSTLTFSILGTSDNGLYTCNSTVSTTSDVPNSQYIVTSEPTQETIIVTVTALPVPTVVISPFSTPTSGGRSVLTCTVTVEDNLAQQPTLQWTNSTGHTQMDGVAANGLTSSLTFDPLLTSNGDQYTCSARIDIPQVGIEDRTSSQSVNLPVQIPSPTVDVSESQSPTHGTNHTFMCVPTIDSSVNTLVNVIYSWTGPRGPLTDNDNYTIVNTDSSSSLTLTPVDQPDISSGNYTCTVIVQPVDGTYISQVTNSGFLNTNVLAAPPPIPTSVVTREGECGQVTSLTCSESVMTNFVSRPVISWVGPNDQTINGDTLTSSELTDTGTYTCMICVTVSKVNIINLCGSTTVPVTNTVPGPVNSLSCRDLSSSTSLGVFWGPPSDNSQSVVGYQVEIRQYISDENKLVTLATLSEQFNKEITFLETSADGLELGVRYSISVEAVSSNGCGSDMTVECYTEEGVPSIVTGVTVDRLNGTAMNVSWEPLTIVEANGFLKPYIVTITRMSASSRKRQTPREEPVSPDESNVIIGGLNPEDNYGVTVHAVTGSQRGLASTSIESGLPPSPPPPSNIAGIVGGIIVAIVFVIIVIVTIIVIYYVVRKNQGKGKFKVSTSRAYEMTPTRSSNVEPTSARPRSPLGDDLDNMESEKSKEAAAEGNEVTHQVTSAEVLDRMKPISLTSFRAHVQEMHDDRAKGFEAEYQSFSLDPLEDHEIAKIPFNRIKNRFANIFPYDHSRVTLKAIPGVEGSEYINACFMHGYQREKCYIAAQGPMPNSLDDFWRMVWEYKLVNIVMLTKCKEGGRVKCEQYWSEDIGSVFETEKKTMIVTTLSVVPFADFVIRQFTLKNTQEPDVEPLKVTQFHFTSWPDHGVPKFATSLISFIRKVQRGHNKDNGVPLLVHCSAGVGRTGTFITLDSMLERIHKETSVNVYQFIKQMRTRRVLMVQTLAQYTFIHDALGELITCGETDIAAGVLRTKVNLLAKSIPGKGITGFTNQFQLLAQVSREPDPEDVTDALEHYNKDKNRYIEKIPYNMSRARLRPTGEDGSEYINASFVDGYKQRNAYIATQGPLKHTVADLWRMIWEFKSKTLVMVCNMEEEGQEASYPYWPVKEDEVIKYGKINVTLQSKAAYGDFTVRKFTIHEERPASAKQLEGFTVTQFHHTEWPPHGRPKTGSLIEMLDMITKSQMSTGNRPITVMCNDGIGRTGTFICVHAQLERLKTEGVVDFFQSIKSARIQRAGLVPDVNQYALCHEVLADYIDKFDNYANFKDMI